jgi:hypothetical protein
VGLASRGQRDMDQGAEAIADAGELRRVRRQASRVHTRALTAAAVVTAVVAVLPL